MRAGALLAAGLLASAMTVSARDRVTLVQYPLMSRPAFYRSSGQGSFSVVCRSSADRSGWVLALELPLLADPVPLQVLSRSFDAAARLQTLTVSVAPGETPPFELYDLRVTAPDGEQDLVRSAVRVLPDADTRFSFVHLPDCHLPACAWIGEYDDPNTVGELETVIDEINLLNPAFVLQTGDIVDNGELESQYIIAQQVLERLQVPVFLTGGNHDLWKNGHENWHAYFGSVMDYTFMFDNVRFLGLEMYDDPVPTYTAAQMNWLQAQLAASLAAGEGARIIFTHFDESEQLTPDFTDEYDVAAVFYGHSHKNLTTATGARSTLKINTSYTMNENMQYRLVQVQNGAVLSYELIRAGNLHAIVSPVNDGTARKVQATISNDNPIGLNGLLVRLHVRNEGTLTVTGGTELQRIAYTDNGIGKAASYIQTDVPAHGTVTVTIESDELQSEPPVIISADPAVDPDLYGKQQLTFSVTAEDGDTPSGTLVYAWQVDGAIVSGAAGSSYLFTAPAVDASRYVDVKVRVSDGTSTASNEWHVYVHRITGPVLQSDVQGFFLHDREITLSWIEPDAGNGRLEFGRQPGQYSGHVDEEGQTNTVTFLPADAGMGLGVYFCRIVSAGLASKEFGLLLESPTAPDVIGPIGRIHTLDPVFEWEGVPGVPYYSLILSNTEIKVTQNPDNDQYEVEGANPVWGVLTSETSVAYGDPDPSGTMPGSPPPLEKGKSYWWAVLNCYGDSPKWTSTVLSGINQFTVDLPGSDLDPPRLVYPADGDTLSAASITFRWEPVDNAAGYTFYPYKIEEEQGIEVRRPIWNEMLTTRNTYLTFNAAGRLINGEYRWVAAAVDEDGSEVQSGERSFYYRAPEARLSLVSMDSKGTAGTGDDTRLPRVDFSVEALEGVSMGLPLFTDDGGSLPDLKFSPGVYVFTAEKERYGPAVDTLRLAAGSSTTATFRLPPDPSFVTGSVRDQFGERVSAASITAVHGLRADLVRRTSTNIDGGFSLAVPPGPWVVTAARTGYQPSGPVPVSVVADSVSRIRDPIIILRNQNQISGSVLNPKGRAVFGAEVTAQRGDVRYSKLTNSSGRYTFQVYDGTWTIQARKNGFTSSAVRQVTAAGGTSLEVTPSLILDPQSAMVTGTVTDGLKMIGGAVVKAVPPSGSPRTGVSDSYGQYSLTLDNGDYLLHAEKPGYSTADAVAVSLTPGETVSGIDVPLEADQGGIAGSITVDGYTPIAGVQVSAGGKTAASNSSGQYRVPLAPGSYTVTAALTGYLSPGPRTVTVNPGQDLENIDFILVPNASVISGRVVSAAGGGIGGCDVRCRNGMTLRTTTDDYGYYELNVEAGTYTITAVRTGFLPDSLQLTVGQGQTADADPLVLNPNTAKLQGTVADSAAGSPLPGARVSVPALGISTVSKSDGAYTLTVPASAAGYLLSLQLTGYAPSSRASGALAAAQVKTVPLLLQPYATAVEGTVMDQQGRPVGNARITGTYQQEQYAAHSAVNGSYVLGLGSVAGTVTLKAEKSGYADHEYQANVSTGQHRYNTNFTLRSRFSRVTGTVREGNGGPAVTFAAVDLYRGGAVIASTVTDESGTFDFVTESGDPFLAADTYTLVVHKQGFVSATLPSFVLNAETTRTESIELTPLTGSLSGIIYDQSDQPVAGANVTAVDTGTGTRHTALSGSAGSFLLGSIEPGTYRMGVSKSGYTSLVDDTVTTSVNTLAYRISRNTGRFRGRIVSRETGAGVPAALAIRDGYGNQLTMNARGDGYYDSADLRLLPTEPLDTQGRHLYTITVSRYGYTTVTRQVSAVLDDTTNFALQPIYGSITGRILGEGTSEPVGDVIVTAVSGASALSDTSGDDGVYRFSRLPVGSYLVSVRKSGYIPPQSRSVSLYNGGDSAGVDFTVEAGNLSRIIISGPTRIANSGAASYSFSARTDDDRQMNLDPVWSVDLPSALHASSAVEAAHIVPARDFIGSLTLYCGDGGDIIDSLRIHVYARLAGGNAADTLSDYRGAQFLFPADCIGDQSLDFSVRYPSMPSARRALTRYALYGNVYALQPAYQNLLTKEMTLVLPLPESAGAEAVMAWWNPGSLKWEIVESPLLLGRPVLKRILLSEAGMPAAAVGVQTLLLAEWTVLVPSRALGLREYEASPNPFSPEWGEGLHLSFILTSNEATQVFLTAAVYSITGEKVRTLSERVPYAKDLPVELVWDGRTDQGAVALNGRYILYFELEDGSAKKQIIKSVVLVK
ncbi:carboxypeptidase regulatory-like domain-containing protein [bacterium]|nr:carboxypeptidase regulatory-like domain-containing protein [bacterium]